MIDINKTSDTVRIYQVKRDGHMYRIDVPRGAVHIAIGSTVVAREDDGKPLAFSQINAIDWKNRMYRRGIGGWETFPSKYWTDDDQRWERDA